MAGTGRIRVELEPGSRDSHQPQTGLIPLRGLRRGLGYGMFLFLVATLLALLEVQIEGQNGWARALPTWRAEGALVKAITGGRPITGYHVYLWFLLLAFLHTPLLFVRVTRELEARLLSWFLLLTVSWDFLWFVWNPSFGLSRFHPDNIWWYSRWVLGFPVDYYVGLGLSLLVYLAGAGSRDRSPARHRSGVALSLRSLY
jgi:hypothetical protein